MIQLLYPIYYRQYGIRRVQQLFNPRLFNFDEFGFPKNAIYHHVSHNEEDLAPNQDQSFFHAYKKRIFLDIVTEMPEVKGFARRINIAPQTLYRNFFLKNRLFKFTRDAVNVNKDPNTLTGIDYGYLQKLYRYTKMPLTNYYQWYNIEKTVWNNILKITNENERQNFVFFNVPDILPSVTSLRMFLNKVNNSFLRVFDTPEKRFVLELWRWIDPETRQDSLFGNFKQENLEKVNIVFIKNNKWCVVNLGVFNKWRKDVAQIKEDQEELKDKSKTPVVNFGYQPVQFQKLMLKFLINIQSQSFIETNETLPEEQTSEQEEIDDQITDQESAPEIEPHKNPEISEPERIHEMVSDSDIKDSETLDFEFDDKIFTDIEKDLNALEYIEQSNLMLKGVKREENDQTPNQSEVKTDKQIEKEITFSINEEDHSKLHEKIYTENSSTEMLKEFINKHAEYGLMSAADYRKAIKQADTFITGPSPYKEDVPMGEFIKVHEELLKLENHDVKIPDITTVQDKSMLESTLLSFDKKYITNVLPKDITAMISNIQKAGVIIQDYQIEYEGGALGEYEIHTIRVKPVDGAASTLRFKIPKIDEEGNYICNGNKYHMRKQRSDLPIRKIDPVTVGLTSYYGKLFVQRSKKKINDSIDWLAKQLLIIGQSGNSDLIKRVAPSNVFDNMFVAPKIYSGLAKYFKSIDIGPYHLFFDHRERLKLFEDDEGKGLSRKAKINAIECFGTRTKVQYRIIGIDSKQNLVLVDYEDNFYLYKNGNYELIGDIYSICLLDQTKSPVDFVELKVFAKTIPLGIVLAYTLGLTNLIKLLRVSPRIFEARQRIDLKADEYVIAFKDKKYVFSRKDKIATLILAGFNEYWRSIKTFFVESFDQKNVYLNVLESGGIGARYLRELENLEQLFIDPITRDLLVEMHKPLTLNGLFMESTEMLTNDMHYDSQDMRVMRIKGYERFAGCIYKEITQAIREYKAKNIRGKSQIDLNPYAVWRGITTDPSVEIVKDINPIENLKQIEAVTYSGTGGRDSGAINKESRAYHESDIGVISEATVDSGDVGVNMFLSANPSFKSIRGITEQFDIKENNQTRLLSTSAITAVGSDKDDVKRVNFVSIQNSHGIAVAGARQPYLRTGYEQIIGQRTGTMFSYSAKEPGKVISITDKGIIVKFDSGEEKGFILGRRFGNAEGSTYPHNVVTNLKLGDTFEAGDNIIYNEGFFEPDFINPKKVVYKSGLTAKVALYESSQTFEDSSSISSRLSNKLSAKTTKVLSYVVDFKQGVKNILKVGTETNPMDILFIIEDEITNEFGLFDDESLATLQKLSNKTPRAKYKGIIDRIEVLYHGSKEDMSTSLRNLVNYSDRELAERLKASGQKVHNGAVTEEYRVKGNPLAVDQAEIKFYITISTTASTGDKGIFANQMKSVIGEVMDYDLSTEDGDSIDAVFGSKSIYNRIVLSPFIIGTSISLLKVIAKRTIEIYRKKDGK